MSEIVCSTTPYSNRRWIPCEFLPVLPNESEGDSLDWLSNAVLAKWSFLRLKFLQIPLLIVCWITELRSLASKTKVSSNWSQKRKGKPSSTNNVAANRQNQRIFIRYVMYGSMYGLPAAKPLTCYEPRMCTICETTNTDRVIYVSWLLKHTAGLKYRSQVTGHRSQVTGHRSQVTGHRSQVTGYRSQVTGHRSQVTGRNKNYLWICSEFVFGSYHLRRICFSLYRSIHPSNPMMSSYFSNFLVWDFKIL